jgi:hypothetical protein
MNTSEIITRSISKIREGEGAPAITVVTAEAGAGWYEVAVVDTYSDHHHEISRIVKVLPDSLTDIGMHAEAAAQELANKHGVRGPIALAKMREADDEAAAY